MSPMFRLSGSDREVVFNDGGNAAVIMAGWTGRSESSVAQHIAELAEVGVAAPREVPVFYRVGANLVTTVTAIEVLGESTSGEIELVVMQAGGRRYVGVGSDHTDNRMEAKSVAFAKQLCPKVMAPELWLFDDVAGHWDKLELTAHLIENGSRVIYQQARAGEFRRPDDMLTLFRQRTSQDPAEWLMFCGACSAIGGIRPTPRLEITLHDPVLGRTLSHTYAVRELDVAS